MICHASSCGNVLMELKDDVMWFSKCETYYIFERETVENKYNEEQKDILRLKRFEMKLSFE